MSITQDDFSATSVMLFRTARQLERQFQRLTPTVYTEIPERGCMIRSETHNGWITVSGFATTEATLSSSALPLWLDRAYLDPLTLAKFRLMILATFATMTPPPEMDGEEARRLTKMFRRHRSNTEQITSVRRPSPDNVYREALTPLNTTVPRAKHPITQAWNALCEIRFHDAQNQASLRTQIEFLVCTSLSLGIYNLERDPTPTEFERLHRAVLLEIACVDAPLHRDDPQLNNTPYRHFDLVQIDSYQLQNLTSALSRRYFHHTSDDSPYNKPGTEDEAGPPLLLK